MLSLRSTSRTCMDCFGSTLKRCWARAATTASQRGKSRPHRRCAPTCEVPACSQATTSVTSLDFCELLDVTVDQVVDVRGEVAGPPPFVSANRVGEAPTTEPLDVVRAPGVPAAFEHRLFPEDAATIPGRG